MIKAIIEGTNGRTLLLGLSDVNLARLTETKAPILFSTQPYQPFDNISIITGSTEDEMKALIERELGGLTNVRVTFVDVGTGKSHPGDSGD